MSEYTDRLVQQTEAMLHFRHDETLTETSPERLHEALSDVIMMEINDRWSRTRHTQQNGRRAYYFSAEYLIGRLIYSNLFNLGILDDIKESFAAKGVDLACLEDIEDAALGNGGLGRLAACFLDSAATLDLPLMGYGLRYRFGLFKQTFENDRQRENADDWTKYGDPWSHRRHHAHRLPRDERVIGSGDRIALAVRLQRQMREMVEEVCRRLNFAARLRDRLSGFQRNEPRQLICAFPQLRRGPPQHVPACRRAHMRPRPMVKRLARRCDGAFRFCAGRPVVPRDDVASRRVAPGIDLVALALDPLPADEKMIVSHLRSSCSHASPR